MLLEKPWGIIKEYTLNQVCTVKVIAIKPWQQTSVHYHRLRDDMWVILDDGLEVQVDDETYHPSEGDEFIIKAGVRHRLRAGEKPGRVLEIDFGFTAQEDIYHLEDGE